MHLVVRLMLIGSLAVPVFQANAEAPPPAKPKVQRPLAGDPSAESSVFWTDWKQTKASPEFETLKKAVGQADKSTAALVATKTNAQVIVNLAVDKPQDAAQLLSQSSAAAHDQASANALSTVLNLVTTEKTREAALAFVAPDAQQRVETMSTNLSTGIQGLPGVYLGDIDHPSESRGDTRPSAPAGYEPVAGGSSGCPVR